MSLSSRPNGSVDMTALVCTYNGLPNIESLLKSIADQDTGQLFRYEVLVVDNNSSDGTRDLAEQYAARYPDVVRVVGEKCQGKSYALNAGLQAARGSVCSVIDQDEVLPGGYLRGVWEAFRAHPDIAFLGGKVLPIWPGPVPSWLTPGYWAPLAICDYGDEPRRIDAGFYVCLITGSFRRSALLSIGGFRGELGIHPGRLGSVEDDDAYNRLIQSGRCGLYLPELVAHHMVGGCRLTKAYHRRWHTGHGQYYSEMRQAGYEATNRRLLGVPGHVYRGAATQALEWLKCTLRGDAARAFSHELQFRFLVGFLRRRWAGNLGTAKQEG